MFFSCGFSKGLCIDRDNAVSDTLTSFRYRKVLAPRTFAIKEALRNSEAY